MQFQILQCLKKRYPKQTNTIRYVILKSAKITANFTAFLATYNCVNNAHMIIEDHSSHQMDDLENHYLKKVAFCQIEISKIQEYFLPTSQGLKKDIDDDIKKIKRCND